MTRLNRAFLVAPLGIWIVVVWKTRDRRRNITPLDEEYRNVSKDHGDAPQKPSAGGGRGQVVLVRQDLHDDRPNRRLFGNQRKRLGLYFCEFARHTRSNKSAGNTSGNGLCKELVKKRAPVWDVRGWGLSVFMGGLGEGGIIQEQEYSQDGERGGRAKIRGRSKSQEKDAQGRKKGREQGRLPNCSVSCG